MKYIVHANDHKCKWDKEFESHDEAVEYVKKLEECKNEWTIEILNNETFLWFSVDEWDKIIGWMMWVCLLIFMSALIFWLWQDEWYCAAKGLDMYAHFWENRWCVNQSELDILIKEQITKIDYGKNNSGEY